MLLRCWWMLFWVCVWWLWRRDRVTIGWAPYRLVAVRRVRPSRRVRRRAHASCREEISVSAINFGFIRLGERALCVFVGHLYTYIYTYIYIYSTIYKYKTEMAFIRWPRASDSPPPTPTFSVALSVRSMRCCFAHVLGAGMSTIKSRFSTGGAWCVCMCLAVCMWLCVVVLWWCGYHR